MNKLVGILKEIDGAGRLVIPKEYRERLMLEGLVELVLTKDGIIIRNPSFEFVEKNNQMLDK